MMGIEERGLWAVIRKSKEENSDEKNINLEIMVESVS